MLTYQNNELTIAWTTDLRKRLNTYLNKSKDTADDWEGYIRAEDQEAWFTFIKTLIQKDYTLALT